MTQSTAGVAAQFPPCWCPPHWSGGNNAFFYPPILEARTFKDKDFGKENMFSDISFVPFAVDHGSCVCMGYRFGDLAYTVDMKSLDEAALAAMN